MANEKVAVILVPGIFASHVTDPRGETVAWPVNKPVGPASMASLAFMRPIDKRKAFARGHLFESTPVHLKPPRNIPRERGWQTVFLSKYQTFLNACHNTPAATLGFEPVVYAAGYNFAVSNEITATRYLRGVVGAVLQQNGPSTRYFFVTHSMGALVVRRMLQVHTDLHENCLGVIHVAAPNAGAPEALMRFIRGIDDTVILEAIFGNEGWRVCTSASRIASGFQLFPFPIRNEDVQVGENKQPLFQALFPPDQIPDPADPFCLGRIIDTNFSQAGAVAVKLVSSNRADRTLEVPDKSRSWKAAKLESDNIRKDTLSHLTEALRLHEALALPSGFFPRTATVSLTGVTTVQAVRLAFDSQTLVQAVEFTDKNGDGTVPLRSQQFGVPARTTTLDGRQISTVQSVNNVSHENALLDTGAINHVLNFMKDFWRPVRP